MAAFTSKDFDVRVPDYTELIVVLSGTKATGEFDTLNEVNGFYFEGGVSGDSVAFVTKARKVKVDKTVAETWAVGEALYWVAGTGKVSNVAGANILIGYCVEAGANGDTEGLMDFDGMLAFAKA